MQKGYYVLLLFNYTIFSNRTNHNCRGSWSKMEADQDLDIWNNTIESTERDNMQFIKNVKQHKPSFNGSSKHYNWYICGKEVCADPTQFNLSQRLHSDYRTSFTTYKGGNYRRKWPLYAVFVRIIFNTTKGDTTMKRQ